MLKLTPQAQGRLLALANGPGYDDLLDVMENICTIEETRLLQLNRGSGATAEQVLSKQDQCRAMRAYFELVQSEVKLQCIKFVESQKRHAPAAEDEPIERHEPTNDQVLGILKDSAPMEEMT